MATLSKHGSIRDLVRRYNLVEVEDWQDMPEYVMSEVEGISSRIRHIFETPKDELFSEICEVTPRTGTLLKECLPTFVGLRSDRPKGRVQSFKTVFEAHERAICVKPLKIWDDPYLNEDRPDWVQGRKEKFQALPEPLVHAYYTKFNGFENPFATFAETSHSGLPYGGSFVWQRVDTILKRWKNSKKNLEKLADLIPDIAPKDKDDFWKLGALIETHYLCEDPRNSFSIMFKTKQKFKEFYVLKADDVDNMQVLKDPIESIDEWCAYLLSGQPADAFEIERYCD
ncbi:hypothetical protein [Alterisphingorhabdus coralli]|uniref:Uncharacterized protein n=1 Tax=Alterisphingorhabdus coralli TaxID=3071408 RepID=A0AA97HZP1_9SPHN|nr:hypothetical protein [Parasphingorhabdus sp. SCSIO 66989]WOE74042.1 hypothetical protein RB602_09225 [Parasphingorhabdus sp. SCSIO 66989]